MGLKDEISRDVLSVFMNVGEFADVVEIMKGGENVTVLGSLQALDVENNAGGDVLARSSFTLYIPYPLPNGATLAPSDRIRVNGAHYSVDSVADELGVATIHLHRGQR